MEDTLVPMTLFSIIPVTVGLVAYFRFKAKREMQMTVRESIGAGQALSPEVLADLMEALQPKKSDLRRGMLWTAVGLAFVVVALVAGHDEATTPLLGISAFPLFIGVAYLILWWIGREE